LVDSRRRPFAPQRLDQAVARDDVVGVQQQERQQAALLRPAERQSRAVASNLDRSEDREFHRSSKPARQAVFQVSARRRPHALRRHSTEKGAVMTATRARLVIGLCLFTFAVLATGAAAHIGDSFAVTSSLDGKTVLPNRILWLAHPSLPPSKIKEVDFLVDGKVRWIEQKSPYSYGDDGEALVTSFLTPGKHRFSVRAIAASGQAATDTVLARVLSTPDPPSGLAGRWQRDVDTSAYQPLPAGEELPSGTYTLNFDRRWIQARFPGAFVPGTGPDSSLHTGHGWLIDAEWTSGPGTLRTQGSVTFRILRDTDQEGGWWCGPGVGSASYQWAVSGTTLTLTLVGRDPCRYRKAIWAGAWTRVP
jgi:hypothetical protein